MTREEFCRIGYVLYGNWWQTEMARHLNFTRRHVRRISAGESGIKPRVAANVKALISQRRAEIEQLERA